MNRRAWKLAREAHKLTGYAKTEVLIKKLDKAQVRAKNNSTHRGATDPERLIHS